MNNPIPDENAIPPGADQPSLEIHFPAVADLLELFGGLPDLTIEILETGLADLERLSSSIDRAWESGDPAQAARDLHALRGGLLTLRVEGVAPLLQRLEQDCLEGGSAAAVPERSLFLAACGVCRDGLRRLIDEVRQSA